MEEFFGQFGLWLWWIVAGVMLIIEIAAPAFFFLWLSIAAAIVGVVVLTYPMGWEIETLIFAVLSMGLLGISRYYYKPSNIQSDDPNLNNRVENMVGKTLYLHEAIENGRGWAKVGDSLWQVEGPELPSKAKVIVVDFQNNILVVKEAEC